MPKNIILGIHGVFRGLKFESDTELVQKGAFFKGLAFGSPFWIDLLNHFPCFV